MLIECLQGGLERIKWKTCVVVVHLDTYTASWQGMLVVGHLCCKIVLEFGSWWALGFFVTLMVRHNIMVARFWVDWLKPAAQVCKALMFPAVG